ncbi:DUF998 domain-containing protein [uncultured Brevundimonas sp.]|uniref:DUF998 domain-containing protein n=1 Tax=uncultured Brevundimonas sp. TaxID=213418 RepID=UPI0030EC20DD
MIRNLAFGCALLSVLILVVLTVAGGLVYPDYDHLTQFISEMGATGVVTGPAVSAGFIVSGVLLTLFWLLCIGLFPRSLLSTAGFGLSALNGVGLMFGGVFPCAFECSLTDPTPSAVLHDVFGGIGYLAGIAGVSLIALAARRWPRDRILYPLGLACGIPAAAAIWLLHPGFEWYGAAQRVVEIALAVFALAVAMRLLARPHGGEVA